MAQSFRTPAAKFASADNGELTQLLLTPMALVPRLAADSKIAAIKELVDCLGEQGVIADRLAFLQAVLERETLQSTVIGDGQIALPHARGRMVQRLGVALGRAAQPIGFPSGDDRHEVDLICLIAVPAEAPGLYLKLLGLLARVFNDADFRQALCQAESTQRMQELLAERTENLHTTTAIPHHQYRS